jgi:thymidylate synthase
MNKLDQQYINLLKDILENGVEKADRTGTGTISVFGRQFRHDMSEGFPLLTTKKMAVKSMMTELKWFLKGDTNIKYLVDNGCNIWNGDAYKNYASKTRARKTINGFINEIKTNDEFAQVWGDLGPIYGAQWRAWESSDLAGGVIDQIKHLIHQLKNNPDSRRLMVNAWNVDALEYMVLPPCHYGFQCYVSEGRLSLMWNQRSVDTFLGLPFNIASYGTLLLLLCEETGLRPGELIGNLGDVHLYTNHIEQAKEQMSREGAQSLPDIVLNNVDVLNGEFDYMILGYESHPPIFAPLSN